MKRIIWMPLLLVLLTGIYRTSEVKAQNTEYNYFYTTLAPHGAWVEIDNGLLAWHPAHVSVRWSPYQLGQWVWTSNGWYWDSYEPFGDITYHYGRWFNDNYYGWLWVPDKEWGPAWVEWRYDNDYIGWAPLSPYATFSITAGLRFSVQYNTPWNNWLFVSYRHFCEPRLSVYYIPSASKHRIFVNTKYRTDYIYEGNRIVNRGVDRTFIERQGRVTIRERDIVRVDNPRANIRRGSERIEVFTPGRDVLTRGDISKVKIERSDRKTSLEVTRVDIGRRDVRTVERSREVVPAPSRETRPAVTNTPQRVEQRTQPDNRKSVQPSRSNERPRSSVSEDRKQQARENRVERNRQQENRTKSEGRKNEEKRESPDRRER